MTPSKPIQVDRARALAFRLQGQHLSQRLPAGALEMAAGAAGLQNTPPGSAAQALHARVEGLEPGHVDRALYEEKRLLQAWSRRASPHLFPTAAAADFTRGLLPQGEQELRFFIQGVVPGLEKVELQAEETLELVAEAAARVLEGRSLTRDELGVEIAAQIAPRLPPTRRPAWESPSIYALGQSLGESIVRFFLYVTGPLGLVCHAERRGNRAYYQLTEDWLGGPLPSRPRDEARAGLVRRYLSCYGPSTPAELAGWAGISPAQAAASWALVEKELAAVRFEGRSVWVLRRDLERLQAPAAPRGARFLPPHDPYLQARDRETLLPNRRLHKEVWRTVGNPGVLLLEGECAGLWRPQKKGRRLRLEVELFAPLWEGQRALIEAEAEALARFRECTALELEVHPI